MDPSRFDTIVKTLVSHPSRRAVLATVGRRLLTAGGVGAVAALLGGLDPEPTVAGCQRKCRKMDNGVQRLCLKRCRNLIAPKDAPTVWCNTDRKRCFDESSDPVCAVCFGPSSESDFQRFVSCYRNKSFCNRQYQSCCEFCADWAGFRCACCS